MTTKEIYELSVKLGIKSDLRGAEHVKKSLTRVKEKYQKLSKEEKASFDTEKLINPYSDTRILVDNNKKKVKKVLVGIDMETPEILLADKLGDVDLVIAHHPEGAALADLSDVMHLQADVLAGYGVPINIAESLMKRRVAEVSRGLAPVNHNRGVDAARLLKIDYMCTHTIADNLGADFLIKKLEKEKPEYVEDILNMLKKIPEYVEGEKQSAGPRLFNGGPENKCGKVAVTEFTGGTSGSKEIYEKMAQAGVGTILSMHMGEEYRKEAEKYHINVVILGHMSSDSLGMNLFLDEIEKKGVEVVTISGLSRIKRIK
ncbi:NGG1p interacting factor NIF3 [Candidatus Parcubacteria bacterium]|nr:MAG: NGG1p interacting factor NIF3 [Candidatus Parcubacteria bacterium]